MTALTVLIVIALFQAAFLVLLAVFVFVRRQVSRARKEAFEAKRRGVAEPLRSWLTSGGSVETFIAALRALPGTSALGLTGSLARTTIPATERAALAVALRAEPWVGDCIAGARSRQWSRRLDAARCLALVGAPADAPQLEALLNDSRPAVAIAAVNALPLVADEGLLGLVLDRFVLLPGVVRYYLHGALRGMRTPVEPPLVARLASDASPRALARWADLAGALELQRALDQVAALAEHPDPIVRTAVAHALRRAPNRRSADALHRLLTDPDAGVRSVAAHALGELGSGTAIPALLTAAHDSSWTTRYRAALALSQLGEPGRAALRSLRGDADRYVADMATLIAGLSDGALLDMVEA